MTTLENVAKLAGVSTATVSRTLNTPEQVESTTRAKVTDAIAKTGYKRNEMARTLASQSSRTIGLLTDTFSSSYFSPILEITTKILHQHGYFTLVEAMGSTPSTTSSETQNRAWHSLTSRQVESVILLSGLINDDLLRRMFSEFPSSVIIGQTIKGAEDRCVSFDHYKGGQLAAEHLLKKGHRQIAMIKGSSYREDSVERAQGFKDELAANNIKLDADAIFEGDYTVDSGRAATKKILKKRDNFTAIFSHNDDMAAGAISELHIAGVDIPNKMSIIGFDNSAIAQAVHPQLTSISQPIKAMGHSAAILALNLSKSQRNKNEFEQPQLRFSPEIIERHSVKQLNTVAEQ